MEETKLASEILKELKTNCKRNFILFIITLVLLFATNAIWLYAWCLPVEETTSTVTTTVDQDTDGCGDNNYIGEGGDVYNGTTENN